MLMLNQGLIKNHYHSFRLATLGPAGTSSEYVAKKVLKDLGIPNHYVVLFDTYEEAYQCVVDGKCNALIVANAYQDINIFYMEESLKLLATFIEATPEYGIAIRPNFDISSLMHAKTVCIASHQAPVNILDTISLERDSIFFGKSFDIKLYTSTSIAAKMVAENEIDYCLTNSKSVEKYELKFASNTKRIDMVWSLFGRPDVMPMFLLAV